ncbi:MAG: aminotransferase class I/II-fold pyridoxal phosphate-dependent enzyme [Breznakibacter sp.]
MNSFKISGFEFSRLEKLLEMTFKHNAINLISPHDSFICPRQLIEDMAKEVLEEGNRPVFYFGEEGLRKKVSVFLRDAYGHVYDADSEVTITGGTNQAIYVAITALVKEGDQVIVFEPSANTFIPAIEMCGGEPVYIKLKEPGFYIDWEDVQKMINGKTRMIFIGSPHNPTGWAMSEIDAIRLQRTINGTKIVVLSDESFQHLVFDGEAHQSMAAYPKLADQSVVVASLSQPYHLSSWPLAYVASSEEMMKEIRKVLQIISQGANSPIQRALSKVFGAKDILIGQSALLQGKRDLFLDAMEGSNFKLAPSKGSCYQLIGLNGATGLSDKDFAMKLIEDHGVATVPLSIFNHEKSKNQYLRIDLYQPDEVLLEVAGRLKRI